MGRNYSNEFRAARWAVLWCETCQEDMVFKFKAKYYPKKRKCPKCGGVAQKRYDESIAYIQKDESQLRRMVRKVDSEGLAKPEADKLLNGLIEGTKKRIADGKGQASHYTPMVPNMDYMVKTGQAKPISDQQKIERLKVQKEISKEVVSIAKKKGYKGSNPSQTI